MSYKGPDINTPKKEYKVGAKHLYLIGIDNYEAGFNKLYNCVNDIIRFKNIVTEYYDFTEENCHILTDEDATRINILKGFKRYRTLKESDQLIIYFSGHGIKENEDGYWIPFGADPKDEFTYLPAYQILRQLEKIKCMHVFLIIDACFSGSFLIKPKTASANPLESMQSRYCLTSSLPTEKAYDGEDHSPFAKAMFKFLKNQDEKCSISELSNFVQGEVSEATSNVQNPVFGELDLTENNNGKFVLYPSNEKFIISILKENQQSDIAANKLFNYLKRKGDIPDAYVMPLTLIGNRIHKLQYLIDEHIISLQEYDNYARLIKLMLVKQIAGLNEQQHKKVNKTQLLISKKLMFGEDVEAIDIMLKKHSSFDPLNNELIKTAIWLDLLKDDVKDKQLSEPTEYLEESNQLINHLLHLSSFKKKDKFIANFKIIKELFTLFGSLSNEYAIFYLKEILIFEDGFSDEWLFWTEFLDRKLQKLSLEHLSSTDPDTLDAIESKLNNIKTGIKYLLQKMLNDVIIYKIINESTLSEKADAFIKISKAQALHFKNIIRNSDIKNAVESIKKHFGDNDFITHLDKELQDTSYYVAHFNPENLGLIYRINRLKVVTKLLAFIDACYYGSMHHNNQLQLMDLKALYEELFRPEMPNTADLDIAEAIKKAQSLIQLGELENSIIYILSLDINEELKDKVLHIKDLFDRNLEDELFTDKDDRILYNRREEIIRKLLSTLDAIKYALSGASLEDTAE